MKPTDVKKELPTASVQAFTMQDIYEAACRAVEEALRQHKARGESVVVWEDEKIVVLKPEDIVLPARD